MPRAMGYKMTHDSGFAPNPFHGYLTLATCKPRVRRCREKGEWVCGFASQALVQRAMEIGVEIPLGGLIYLMEITEAPITLDRYYLDPRFAAKRPDMTGRDAKRTCGDAIYWRHPDGLYRQEKNPHHGEDLMREDISGVNALVSTNFWYFGRNCFVPQGGWSALLGEPFTPARTFWCPDNFVPSMTAYFLQRGVRPGIHGMPCLWTEETQQPTGRSCG